MASQTQFKQQCPSCEAMVPIKDPSLVGKKVDCPKCKYRFVVEDPGNGVDVGADSESSIKTKPVATKAKPSEGVKSGKPKSKLRPSEDETADGKRRKPAGTKGAPTMLIVGIAFGVLAVSAPVP